VTRLVATAAAAAALLLVPRLAAACAVCFGDPNAQMRRRARGVPCSNLGAVQSVSESFSCTWRRAGVLIRAAPVFRLVKVRKATMDIQLLFSPSWRRHGGDLPHVLPPSADGRALHRLGHLLH
jgi:hypothetical protein